ncbi:MAG: hypothetical protein E7240_10535 [Lachnospiraceae bacterium]|nr:hypothetical protein [Lachnospiraceae bacterium]
MKKRQNHITSFYLETLLLIGVLITIILVISQIFGIGQKQSKDAKMLTNAVTLAANTAEAVAGSDSLETLAELLDENGNVQSTMSEVNAYYRTDMTPDPNGEILVSATWEPSEENGELVTSRITVFYEKLDNPVYTLETAVYTGK